MRRRCGSWIAATLVVASGTGCRDTRPSSVEAPALAISPSSAALIVRLDSANAMYRAGETGLAAERLAALVDAAVAAGDPFVETESLTRLALTDRRLGTLHQGLERAQQSLDAKRRYGLTDSLFRSYNTLGLILWDLGRLGAAADHFTAALAEAERLAQPRLVATARGNQGLIQHDLGDFAGAQEAFSHLLETGRALGVPIYEANALTNLGMLAISVGDPGTAVPRLDSAVAIYRREAHPDEQIALGHLHAALMDLGRPADAFAALNHALQRSRETGEPGEEARNLQALGDYYRDAGDLVRARTLYDSALAGYETLQLPVEAGATHRAIAEVFLAVGEPLLAWRHVDDAIRLHQEAGDRFELFVDELILIEAQASAEESYESALTAARAIATNFDAPSFLIALALVEARIADRNGDAARVVEVLQPFERKEIPVNAPAAQAEIDALLSRAYATLGQTTRALELGRSAVRAVELVRGGFGSSFFRTSFVATRTAVYGHLADLLLGTGDVAGAFEVIDAARGRALIEHVASTEPPEDGTASLTLARLSEAERLLRTIGQLASRVLESEAEIWGERSRIEEDRLAEELARARSRYELLSLQAVERDRPGTSLLGQTIVSLADVQSVLEPDEALIEYLVGDERLLAVWITSDTAGAVSGLISTANLLTKVRVARDLLASPDARPNELAPILGDLYDILIRPYREHLPPAVDRLTIVPHTYLNYLPFAALRDPADGRYLTQEYELSLLPSASALWALRDRSPGPEPTAPGSVTGFAPFDRRLPATRDEVRAIAAAFDATRVRRGRRATERALREALGAPGIVHIATHAVLNQRNPLFSAIDLSPGRGTANDDDGRLELHEVLSLDISSQLVFLSGCETGVGSAWTTRFTPGEDYATLAQAFLYAGAANVVSTLWRIEDQGAARFAAGFYDALRERDPVGALAIAQRQAIRREAPLYHWAPYTTSGVGSYVSR